MNNDLVNEIRSKLDIVNVISSYISLEKKGRNYFGLCPFHDDHSPSLSVSPDKQIYKCFVCGESGNVFNFVMNYEHISFQEALQVLAKDAGIDINVNIKHDNRYDKFYNIMDLANNYYQNNLSSKEGAKARKYLEDRKLTSETIKEFGIGLSLDKRDELTNLLISKGNSLEELNDIDLSNTNHDTFINRIMFPLYNANGKVIGFSGRIYNGEDLNKYQNTKETVIFKKRENLFNYHRAREEIRKSKSLIVMEGFMAVIRAHTVGIKNCIATMGTALASEQLALIKKLSNNIYLCYDGDNAGRTATLKNGEEFLKAGINTRVISLSDGLDPDDYIIKYGKDAFQNLIDTAISFTDYKIKALKNNYNLSNVNDKTNYVNQVLSEIARENDEIKREIMLKNLADETNVWYNTLEKKLFSIMDKKEHVNEKEEVIVKSKKKDGYNKAIDSIIYYMLNYPEVITFIDDSNLIIPIKDIRILINEIIAYYTRYGSISEADFYTYLLDKKELLDVLKRILSSNYPEYSMDVVKENVRAINNYNIALEIKKLENLIKETEDINEQMKLMDRIRQLKLSEEKE